VNRLFILSFTLVAGLLHEVNRSGSLPWWGGETNSEPS